MNRTNCAPGGKASQAGRSPELRSALGRAAAKAIWTCKCLRCTPKARSEIGRKGGTISQARKTPEERSAAGSHAAQARWAMVWCQRCEAPVRKASLLDGEACPRCRLVL